MRESIFVIQVGEKELHYQTDAPKDILRSCFGYDMNPQDFMQSVRNKGYQVERLRADLYLGFNENNF